MHCIFKLLVKAMQVGSLKGTRETGFAAAKIVSMVVSARVLQGVQACTSFRRIITGINKPFVSPSISLFSQFSRISHFIIPFPHTRFLTMVFESFKPDMESLRQQPLKCVHTCSKFQNLP